MSYSYWEIERLVKERFPVTDQEKKCNTEKNARNALRDEMRKGLRTGLWSNRLKEWMFLTGRTESV